MSIRPQPHTSFDALARAFRRAFAAAIVEPTITWGNDIAWRDGNCVSSCHLVGYTWPSLWRPGAPRCVRIAVNWFNFDATGAGLRRLGFDTTLDPCPRRGQRHLKWTVLAPELLAFAPWLAALVCSWRDPAVLVPPLPHACDVAARDVAGATYGWSIAAKEAQED